MDCRAASTDLFIDYFAEIDLLLFYQQWARHSPS
jgi:hypothetical protein